MSDIYCMQRFFKDIDIKKIKGVLVDFDNTLYEYAPCHKAGLEEAYSMYIQKDPVSYDIFLDLYGSAQKEVKAKTLNQAASHSRLLYFQKMIEMRDGATNVVESLKMEDVYWSAFIKTIQLRKEIIDFLAFCRKEGVKTCLITDLTASVQFRKMVAIGVDTLVDYVVTSEESGVEKPDQAIFALALSKLGLSGEDTVIIGDDKIKDIDGARKLGIKGYMV